MVLYQCIKFNILSEIYSGQIFIAKMKMESNSVNTVDRVMILALCKFPYDTLSVNQVSFNYLQYF